MPGEAGEQRFQRGGLQSGNRDTKGEGMKNRWKQTAWGLCPIMAAETVNYQRERQTEEGKQLPLQECATQERKQCTQQFRHCLGHRCKSPVTKAV